MCAMSNYTKWIYAMRNLEKIVSGRAHEQTERLDSQSETKLLEFHLGFSY